MFQLCFRLNERASASEVRNIDREVRSLPAIDDDEFVDDRSFGMFFLS